MLEFFVLFITKVTCFCTKLLLMSGFTGKHFPFLSALLPAWLGERLLKQTWHFFSLSFFFHSLVLNLVLWSCCYPSTLQRQRSSVCWDRHAWLSANQQHLSQLPWSPRRVSAAPVLLLWWKSLFTYFQFCSLQSPPFAWFEKCRISCICQSSMWNSDFLWWKNMLRTVLAVSQVHLICTRTFIDLGSLGGSGRPGLQSL